MNFLKNSIFSRGAGDSSPDWEPENENQMLAVWGSPGSGKTTTAVKLAARLAMQKKDVALLLCDMNTPMLPCICPPGDLEEEHSLGSVLAATHVSESLVRHNCITHKKIRHLTILGMRKGENEYTYPPYERTQAEELLQCLRKIAPYIIVDCGSCIANDILSAIALMEADAVLRLVNCPSVIFPASFRFLRTVSGMQKSSIKWPAMYIPMRPANTLNGCSAMWHSRSLIPRK